MTKVPFIGHIATADGLCVDPDKIRAITEMPPPVDVAAVQRLLGLTQYLSKFLPHLSDLTKPLRELTQRDVIWIWDHAQQQALDSLKKAVTNTPVLRYYNLQEEVTLQCDASQFGLGATLMQNGQPVAYASRALTSADTRYAQIEKELLAIVFVCDRFEMYVYGRKEINVETDHQPLELIMQKPLNSAPKRLQRMLLKLQKYSLIVKYKKGRHMFLADTLSRAFLPEIHMCYFLQDLGSIDHTMSLELSNERLQQFKHVSADDPVLQQLRKIIQQGWPASKSEVPGVLYAYYDFRDELTIQDELVFKGPLIVVPAPMRKEMMAISHATHIGVEGCMRRARETMYWPRMSTELKEDIGKCDICMAHRAVPGKEPLQQHDFVARPWSKVGADVCDLQGRTLLVLCDYYSNFIEVENISKITTQGVSKGLKIMFSRYGIPNELVTDNGPQFSFAEFTRFSKSWGFNHVTSSPHYPQSNGKAENAVKTVKRLFMKCRDSGQSEYLALLDWRNTPSEGIGTSPPQRFLGRRCTTRLPVSRQLLQPRYSTEDDTEALVTRKERQKYYYDQHAMSLQPIAVGDTVWMRLPGQTTWSAGICTDTLGPRSYAVKMGERVFRRNRRQLIRSDNLSQPFVQPAPQPEQPYWSGAIPERDSAEDGGQGLDSSSKNTPPLVPQSPVAPPPRRSDRVCRPPQWSSQNTPPLVPQSLVAPPLRRSDRVCRPPQWSADYVP